MEIINHKTGDKCHMKFEPYSYFGGIAKKVTGTVITADEKVKISFIISPVVFKYAEMFCSFQETHLEGISKMISESCFLYYQ